MKRAGNKLGVVYPRDTDTLSWKPGRKNPPEIPSPRSRLDRAYVVRYRGKIQFSLSASRPFICSTGALSANKQRRYAAARFPRKRREIRAWIDRFASVFAAA
ncbi:hypothetical protein WN48_02290 [Eufriesea mexicana]|nr:hypothetical protein WN48_02290 [Eufriesea mexicana]